MYVLNFTRDGQPKMLKTERTKRCPIGKMMERKTKKCVKQVCPAGKMINPLTGRCINKVTKCSKGKMISPTTGRCVKMTDNWMLDYM